MGRCGQRSRTRAIGAERETGRSDAWKIRYNCRPSRSESVKGQISAREQECRRNSWPQTSPSRRQPRVIFHPSGGSDGGCGEKREGRLDRSERLPKYSFPLIAAHLFDAVRGRKNATSSLNLCVQFRSADTCHKTHAFWPRQLHATATWLRWQSMRKRPGTARCFAKLGCV